MKFVVYSHTSTFYGAPKSMLELTDSLKDRGHEFTYILPEKGLFFDALIDRNYRVEILPNPEWICAPRALEYSKYFYFKHRIKLIYSFFYQFFKSFNKHIRINREINPDFIIINTSAAPMGIPIGVFLKKKTILWVRESILNKQGWLISGLFPHFVFRFVFKRANLILGPSRFISDYFKQKKLADDVKIISDPVFLINKTSIQFRLKPDLSFGLVGYITERKGQLDFVQEMVKWNSNYKVYLFGHANHDNMKSINSLSKKHPNQIFQFPFEKDINKIYESFDIYVNNGVDETFGRTTVEAMGMGKIVFGRNSGATPEIIQHNLNGFLFEKVSEIFEIIETLNSKEGEEKLNIIVRNAHNFSKRFNPKGLADEFLNLVNSLSFR